MIKIDHTPQTSMDLIRLILINQMGLNQERVNIYDEKWVIPPDDNLFIVIEYRNGSVISNRNLFENLPGYETPTEIQIVNMFEKIVVGVFSRNREATQRKEEVFMAILSSYAQLQQEKFSFKIARAGNIEDLSSLEGAAMLKRYDIELSVYAWYKKVISPDFMQPPYLIEVTANDASTGIIQEEITQFLALPK